MVGVTRSKVFADDLLNCLADPNQWEFHGNAESKQCGPVSYVCISRHGSDIHNIFKNIGMK